MHFYVNLSIDPFVDDSDEIAQVTAELKKRKLKTVHGGFFVSSGELEVLKDQENSRKPNLGRLDADTVLHNIPTDFILSDIKVPMKLKLVKNQKGRSSKEILPQNKAPSSLTSPESEVITGVRMRCIKVKPPWEPSSVSLAALETFKNSFQKMNIVMGKSGALPSQVAMIMSTDACTTHLLQP